jgi:hypothetical protein
VRFSVILKFPKPQTGKLLKRPAALDWGWCSDRHRLQVSVRLRRRGQPRRTEQAAVALYYLEAALSYLEKDSPTGKAEDGVNAARRRPLSLGTGPH